MAASGGRGGVVRQGLELGVGLGSRMEVLGLGAIFRLPRLYLDLGLGWGKGPQCSGDRIQGWGSPLSSMGLWDRMSACSTQLPFSPNTPASFWTKSLQGRGGRICPELSPKSPDPGWPPSPNPICSSGWVYNVRGPHGGGTTWG